MTPDIGERVEYVEADDGTVWFWTYTPEEMKSGVPTRNATVRQSRPGPMSERCGQVPTEHLRSMIRLLFPDEMTPVAKRHLEAMCDQWDEASVIGRTAEPQP